MLLLLPRIDDYTGGYTMLGLGDIVLPGLLVAFAARYVYFFCDILSETKWAIWRGREGGREQIMSFIS